ncbi:EF-hand calcium-binding domain-containing protein 4A [Carassius carassius]|uniref:EF-hand calcium-binding domain-containing protein 4A n=1 Tax=Carassius carassius TaxID=217509 RepID=UPI002868B0FD|nr:EF-hand calcium-binding domain-containing protein 4A [Carassius carassius]XP_059391781.1 EF-hand calcium-binding domain-containing protein 4A [Carassius carassius]
MSGWLKDGVVLEGTGSGQMPPRSSLLSPLPNRTARLHSSNDATSPDSDRMSKAKELFELCDKEGKGFITKRDMQRLQQELPLSPEQLESVFESLDRDRNGYLTPLEFHTGLGELVGSGPEERTESRGGEMVREERIEPMQIRFTHILMELGADKLFKDQWELCTLWCELQRDKPELLGVLEEVLSYTVSHLQDALKERDNLEQALCRREEDHDRVVRSMYEDMESQLKEEREKRQALDSMRQGDKKEQLLQELKMREQELEFTLTKQRELESRINSLSSDQTDTRGENRRLQNINQQLQDQLDKSREELQHALSQLQQLQNTIKQQQKGKERDVMKVSRNMQKERESLMRQLDLLRDMNKRLRDDKDAHQTQKMTAQMKNALQRKESILGNYFPPRKSAQRQLMENPDDESEDSDSSLTDSSPKRLSIAEEREDKTTCQSEKTTSTLHDPERVFKVVFLGNSAVGKSSFIHHYCSGHFPNNLASTVGMDFQVRSVMLDSTPVALQLWDTAGQERFHSITQQYFRRADGIIAMYDLTHEASFTAVCHWLDQVQENMAEGACLMLLGNKTDLVSADRREVTRAQGRRLAEQYQAVFYECSAKSGQQVEEAMTHLTRLLASQEDKQCESVLRLDVSANRGRCCK